MTNHMDTLLFPKILAHAQATPTKVAIITESATLTYHELAEQIKLASAMLSQLGVVSGDRLLFYDEDKRGYLITLLAASDVGAIFVPLHPQSPGAWRATVAAEVGAVMTISGLASLLLGQVTVHTENRALPIGLTPKNTACDLLAIIMTSGTTGVPKAVPIHRGMVLAAAQNVCAAFELTSAAIFLDYIPAFTIGGLFLTGLPQLLAGCTSLVYGFSPFTFTSLVTMHHPTHTILLPTMVALLRNSTSWSESDLSSFVCIASGASTVPELVADTLLAHGAQSFLHLFGMTECLTPVFWHRVRAGAAANLIPKTIFSHLAGDYAARLGPDGELWLRGSAVTRGYLGDETLNQTAFSDGWFRTGDLFIQEGGTWQFLGRKKEILKVEGFSVSPALTEKRILDFPNIRNCVVIKETLRSGGEALVAVVEGDAIDERRLLGYCRIHLPPAQCPRRVVTVQTIPTNSMRKPDRVATARLILEREA